MKNSFFSRISILLIFISVNFAAVYAQDTIAPKTTPKPVIRKPAGAVPPKQVPAGNVQHAGQPAAKPGVVPTQHAAVPGAPPVVQPYQAPVYNPTDKSLNGQYQFLLTRMSHYQQPMIGAFYKNIQDSLNVARRKLKDVQGKLTEQSKKVADLQSSINAQQENLSQSQQRVDAINVFGATVPKSTYNYIMWGLVILFGALAAIVILRSGSYSREAKYRIKLYEELDEEYKTYKTKANEKEKKLARELQTVRNKLEEITGKPEY